jgi:uncharacterized membrane protein
MSLIGLIVILCVIGLVLFFVNTKEVPMPGWLKTVINVVAAIVVIVLLLQVFGVWDEAKSVQVPKL